MSVDELLRVTGNSSLVYEGIKALEAVGELVKENDNLEISEIRIYENMPIEMLIADTGDADSPFLTFALYQWDGEKVVFKEYTG